MLKYNTVLLTGGNGYLLSNLIDFFKIHFENVIFFDGDISDFKNIENLKTNYKTIDCIVHFASPSDKIDFQNKSKVNKTMLFGSIYLIELAKQFKSKFIFASSMAVEFMNDLNTQYGAYKLAIEQYLINTNLNYLILRIPRVYDKSRKKGLIKQLKEDEVLLIDYDKIIYDIISLPDLFSISVYDEYQFHLSSSSNNFNFMFLYF